MKHPEIFLYTNIRVSNSKTNEKENKEHLIHKWMVHEVWPTNAEVQDIDLLKDGIVEGIQEPGSVGHLIETLLINIINLIHAVLR